jgi:hypothetical protein
MDQFDRLWALLPHPEGSTVRYMARKRAGTSEHVVGDNADTVMELRGAAHAWGADGYNVYVQPNPTRERARSRTRSADVTHWSWLLIDIDPIPGRDAEPLTALALYLDRLRSEVGPIHPTILDSGRGAQAWLRLEDLEFDNEEARHVARRVSGFWLRHLWETVGEVSGCMLDTSTSDLPRVMRMPGTVNQKTGRPATILTEGSVHPGLAQTLVERTPASEFRTQATCEGPVDGRQWQDVLPLLSLTAANFLRGGAAEPGRHKSAVATVYSMKENGLTPEAALAGLIRGAGLCDPPLEDPEWVERVVRDAYR